ncbi:hypothetical protein BU24DRAFT_346359 [Aaosphaeria arxii CBS 175.79]|uniref:histone deacetylase n=1 Tax=Aaosphaeria arxii CBS 175.79 TaxID=1450172 RepID=A0A6A5XWG0_9PLEO|nr:uncharacterized protein BU24DRAFT_346359 [Aaosphaeria arxii CBS 175.79]KAF2016574.1 hypothetical protein BU24DRAFT_346359 [Aaosphaeria arxii CBS 175.79]
MDDEDFIMGDESVLATTEVNGNHLANTVDPSKLALRDNLEPRFSPIKDELPILSHGELTHAYTHPIPTDSSDTGSLFNGPPVASRSRDTSPDMETDEMDVTSTTSSYVQVRVPPPPTFPPLSYSSSKTGLVYDSRMRFHAEPVALMLNQNDIHPEDPRRIHEIFEEIREAGLVQGPEDDEESSQHEQCWRIHTRPATRGEICLIHTPEHYKFLGELSSGMDSIYFNNSTFDSARLAAGGAIEACRAVVRGDVRNSIAIIRPPGHHAECDQPSGFCIFNNVPIAARVCQENFPNECRKVLILDWDVHHGNGVQHAFYNDPNVLYISLHVFKGGKFYPGMPDADYNYCGDGPGIGKNVNIPWDEHGMGDAEYIYAFQEVVVPIASEFDPDLVIISAGFDAAEGDLLGGCHVTPACYAHMTHMLMRLAQGKIAVCLEGGYNLRSIARSALAVTRTLMLQPPDRLAEDLGPPKESCVHTIEQVKREQSKYWKCMFPKHLEKNTPTSDATRRLHEIIREWQCRTLAEEHSMHPLTIKRSGISETFQYNVIATPHFMEARPLLVIFHDPPGVMNMVDPMTGKTELHNTWLTDVSKRYIDWAIAEGFEVIDVNIPKIVDMEDDDGGLVEADSPEMRGQQTKELATYLWENYIEPHDATQVFLLGIGAAYLGLVDMLSIHENSTDPDTGIQYIMGFVAQTPIHSIKRSTDDNIGNWFYAHSSVFVANNHHVWDPNRTRKIRRKYGKLKKSDHSDLNEMLAEHMEEVQAILLEKKTAYELEMKELSMAAEEEEHKLEQQDQPLRSPPLPSEFASPRVSDIDVRPSSNGGAAAGGRATPLRSPRLSSQGPQLGFFSVPSTSSPRSPKSPMKRTF